MSAKSMKDIAVYLNGLHFRKKWFRGVDEADVWRKLEQLHGEYQSAFDAQSERSRALLEERESEIHRLKEQMSGGKQPCSEHDGKDTKK